MGNLWRVSATEVKNSWGRVVRCVLQRRESALVDSKGLATVLDDAERFAQEIAARYPLRPLLDSTEIIREMREERDGELTP